MSWPKKLFLKEQHLKIALCKARKNRVFLCFSSDALHVAQSAQLFHIELEEIYRRLSLEMLYMANLRIRSHDIQHQ